ncbi:MAG: STAS/SEC14 domain-containing protein [Beijerinckiaceae bacterium]
MLSIDQKLDGNVLVLSPDGALTHDDFQRLSETIKAREASGRRIRALVIHSKTFPGWATFRALRDHLQFVRAHHRQLERVAVASDSAILRSAVRAAGKLLSPDIQVFGFNEVDTAIAWAGGAPPAAHNMVSRSSVDENSDRDEEELMFMRISWGRIREGGWLEYEERFKKLALDNIKQGGPTRRWLVRDLDEPDAGFAISIFDTEEEMRNWANNPEARERVKTEMTDLYIGDYRVRNCEVRFKTD